MLVPAEAPLSDTRPRPGEVLVIDLDPVTRALLCDLLKGAGVAAHGADPDAVELERDQDGSSPAAILLHDGRNGFQRRDLITTLRARHPETLLVLIGEPGAGEQRVRADGPGLTSYLEKPFEVSDLLAVVWRTVGPLPTPRGPRASRRVQRRSRLRADHSPPSLAETGAARRLGAPGRTVPAA